jgi:transposase
MARMVLGDAQWAALRLVIQRIPHAWRKHEPGLRLFVEAALWIDRTGAPWRDLPGEFGQWASVYHRFRRWSERGWWSIGFEAGRPVVPKDGLAFADSTPCKAHRSSAGAAAPKPSVSAGHAAVSRPKSTPASTGTAQSCASSSAPDTTRICATQRLFWPISPPPTPRLTVAMSRPSCGKNCCAAAAPSTLRQRKTWSIRRRATRQSMPGGTWWRTFSPASRTLAGSRFGGTRPAEAGSASSIWPRQ